MADLYTSLVRAKQELNGGVLPAMTPIPEKLHAVLDPEFTIGMGALMEDATMGLRCPVRDCGLWGHDLKRHMDKSHKDIGGADGIRRKLGIPLTAPLASSRRRAQMSENMLRTRARIGHTGTIGTPEARAKANRARLSGTDPREIVGVRNFQNRCDAQLRQRMLSVRDRIGRSPSAKEAAMLDPSLVSAVQLAYGSWDNAKRVVGLDVLIAQPRLGFRKHSRADVLECLAEFHQTNGRLPYRREFKSPALPCKESIVRAMGADSWGVAMMTARAALGLPDVRNRRPRGPVTTHATTCKHCGSGFDYRQHGDRKQGFCSQKCFKESRKVVAA